MKISDVLRGKGPRAEGADGAGATGTEAQVVTIAPGARVADLLDLLAEHGIGAVVVAGDEGSLEGIVSERDVVRHLQQRGAGVLEEPVSQIMTAQVKTCVEEDEISSVAETMTDGRFRHLPVLREGRLVGIVSIGDVVSFRIRALAAERDQLEAYIRQ